MSQPDGLNPTDPGVQQLARVAREVAPAQLLLAYCGELPGLEAGATRLILDVREHTGSAHHCIPTGLGTDPLVDRRFEAAICWPRAHLGIDFSLQSLAYGAMHLAPGGVLYCAARKQKGGKRLGQTMERLLGNVSVLGRERGYHLYAARAADTTDEGLAAELLSPEYFIEDPILGDLRLRAVPGVFSRRGLDAGTRTLISHLANAELPPGMERAIDLGAGIGPLALWAAQRFASLAVLAIESNYRAAALIEENAAKHGLGPRVHVKTSDGLGGLEQEDVESHRGRTQLLLTNPPTHAGSEQLGEMLGEVGQWLSPGGKAFAVVNRAGRAIEAFRAVGLSVRSHEYPGYVVLEATR